MLDAKRIVLRTALFVALVAFLHASECSAHEELPESPQHSELDAFLYDDDLGLCWNQQQACGVLAAYMVLGMTGHPVSLSDVAGSIPVSVRGTSMADLVSYLESRDLSVSAIEVDGDDLVQILGQSPEVLAITWLDEGHWVVVESAYGGAVRYYEYPEWRTVPVEEFKERYSNRAVVIGREDVEAKLSARQRYNDFQWRLSILLAGIVIPLALFHAIKQMKKNQGSNA